MAKRMIRMMAIFVGWAGVVDMAKFEFSRLTMKEKAKDSKDESSLIRTDYYYDGKPISPWHDLPFSIDDEELLTFVCEIPLGERAKVEINKSERHNPLIQDTTKDGTPRYYKYSASTVNYGAIAQTWEDPGAMDNDTGLGGDNDPIDVLQLNGEPCARGAIQSVRVLGALALIDGEETDWKLLVVDVNGREIESRWKEVTDIPAGRVDSLRNWFKVYKTAEGKGENRYGLDGRAVDRAHAMRVARETHGHWRALVQKEKPCTYGDSPCWVGGEPESTSSEIPSKVSHGGEL